MLKSLVQLWNTVLDAILPPRTDFDIVRKLTEEEIQNLPRANQVEQEWIHPLFSYRHNKVRAIVWEIKYKDHTKPLDTIGKLLYDEILDLISDIQTFDNDAEFLLIPIPISQKRRSERGYNQSEYIAKAILEHDPAHTLLYAPQWLLKTKETEEQNKSHGKVERLENLKDCFEADPRVGGKHVILIDDVVTTGATLSEARETLFKAGAKDVYAFTIAH